MLKKEHLNMEFIDLDETKSDFFDKLEIYYQNQIFPCKKTTGDVLNYINRTFGLTLLGENDLTAKKIESYHDVEQVIDKFNHLFIYELNLGSATEKFYKYHEAHYSKGYPILIFYCREEDFLDSNCALLQYVLKILQGIDSDDIDSHSSRFKDYLNSMYLLEWSMAINLTELDMMKE